jgi:hypothetical protein
MIVQKCKARKHPHLGACVLVEREIADPVPRPSRNGDSSLTPPTIPLPVPSSPAKLSGDELILARKAPVSPIEGATSNSAEEARELLARAVADIALQRPSLRRLRRLLRSEDDKVSSGTWEQVMTFLRASKGEGGSNKPIQIQLNSFVPRPGVTSATVKVG